MTWPGGPLVVATALGSHLENRVCTGLSDLEVHPLKSCKNSSWRQVTSSKRDSKPTLEKEKAKPISSVCGSCWAPEPSPYPCFLAFWLLKPAPSSPAASAPAAQLLGPPPGRPGQPPSQAVQRPWPQLPTSAGAWCQQTAQVSRRVAARPTFPGWCWPRQQIRTCPSQALHYLTEAADNPTRRGHLSPGSSGGNKVRGS